MKLIERISNYLNENNDIKQQKQKALGLEHIAYNHYKNKNNDRFDWNGSEFIKVDIKHNFTKEFLDWFGDSKVIDKNGNPLVVYHGTDSDFDEFKHGFRENGNKFGSGFYFTPKKDVSNKYGKNLKEIYLKIDNMLDFDNLKDSDRKKLISNIKKNVDENILVGFYPKLRKYFSENEIEKARDFYDMKSDESNDYYHDRTKALVDKDDKGIYVEYTDFHSSMIKDSDLLKIIQMYDRTPLNNLGYDGVKVGDEILVFSPNQIKSIHNKGTYSKISNKITENEQ